MASTMIETLFNEIMIKNISKEIMKTRKCLGDDIFTYDNIEKEVEGKKYVLKSYHVSVIEAMKNAKSSCKNCYGTGRVILNLNKDTQYNIVDFVVLSDIPTKDMSQEDKEVSSCRLI